MINTTRGTYDSNSFLRGTHDIQKSQIILKYN